MAYVKLLSEQVLKRNLCVSFCYYTEFWNQCCFESWKLCAVCFAGITYSGCLNVTQFVNGESLTASTSSLLSVSSRSLARISSLCLSTTSFSFFITWRSRSDIPEKQKLLFSRSPHDSRNYTWDKNIGHGINRMGLYYPDTSDTCDTMW